MYYSSWLSFSYISGLVLKDSMSCLQLSIRFDDIRALWSMHDYGMAVMYACFKLNFLKTVSAESEITSL